MKALIVAGFVTLVAVSLGAQIAQAQDAIPVTLFPEAAFSDAEITWSAVPVPGTTTAIEAIAMPYSITGDWETEMEPGEWMVEGYSPLGLFSATITVEDGDVSAFEIPLTSEGNGTGLIASYQCDSAPSCAVQDDETGLSFDLPQGWAVDGPYVADLGGGEMADVPSAVFYEDVMGGEGAGWWLNPVDWAPENGPCYEVSAGNLCAPVENAATEAAFAIIAPSIAVN